MIVRTSLTTSVIIPSRWCELPSRYVDYAYRLLADVLLGKIEPFEFQLGMLKKMHSIKTRPTFRWWHYLTKSGNEYRRWYKQELERIDKVLCGLIYLADSCTFAFEVDDESKEIKPKYDLPRNPFPHLGNAPSFNRGLSTETNFTARQYVDCYDIETALQSEQCKSDIDLSMKLMRKMSQVIYGISESKAESLEIWKLILIRYWFQSITAFFVYHPVYSILYKTHPVASDVDRISMGLDETIMQLSKSGYQDVENMDVIKFFGLQLKELKDQISKAVASGVKESTIVEDTGLDLITIQRLSK